MLKPALFQVPELKVFILGTGRSRFGHTFGGRPQHKGIRPRGGKQALHLVYTLNLADPAVGIRVPGLQKLPLYHGFVYNGCGLSYRVVSDREIRIQKMYSLEIPSDFPYEDYPAEFPESPVRLQQVNFDPKRRAGDLIGLAGVFGFDWIPRGERRRFYRILVKDFERHNYCESPVPKSISAMRGFYYSPFTQGPPEFGCATPKCSGRMQVLAVISNEPVRKTLLWGEEGEDVLLVFLICRRCYSIQTYNECT